MNQRTASLAALIVAVMTVVAVPAAGLGPGAIPGTQGPTDEEANETNAEAAENGTANETPPGSQLTGIIGVQKAEIEGEVQSRGFEIALNRSGNNASKKAGVIAEQVTDLESRLDALRERKDELEQARDNGTITEGEYRARIAEIGARIATVQRLANQTANASRGIPDEALQERGVNVTKIQELRNNARNLSGQEVAAIARDIAGPGVGKGLGRGPPANKTPPGLGDGGPGMGNGPGDDAPGNGPPGAGEPGPPGSNDDNETDTPGDDAPGMGNDSDDDDRDVPVIDEPGDGPNAPGNETSTDDGGESDGEGDGIPLPPSAVPSIGG